MMHNQKTHENTQHDYYYLIFNCRLAAYSMDI